MLGQDQEHRTEQRILSQLKFLLLTQYRATQKSLRAALAKRPVNFGAGSPVCLELKVKNPINSQKMKHFPSQARAAFPELLESQSCTAQPVPQPQMFFLKDFPYLSGTRHLLSVRKALK